MAAAAKYPMVLGIVEDMTFSHDAMLGPSDQSLGLSSATWKKV